MEKMKKLDYIEKPSFRSASDNENNVSFALENLERGFGDTLGVALRRTLISSISSLAPFAVKIDGVHHEFQPIKNVVEDVPSLILNIRKVRFTYNPSAVSDNDIIKVTLMDHGQKGVITSGMLEVSNHPSVQVVDTNIHLAEINEEKALKLEIFLRPGRGYVTFEENKQYLAKRLSELDSDIDKGEFIAVDSDFSPVKRVTYNVKELNSSSNKHEESLQFNLETDGSISAKDAVSEACTILVAMFSQLGDVDTMRSDEIFEKQQEVEEVKEEDDVDISQLGLSVRSYNALKRIRKTKLSDLKSMTREELENTKNLGKKSVAEIDEKLREYGYELSERDK
ncbi:DNA-directed RNA polymerase subunit alpha [Mycoplasma corogypsi]|uniref:DNA-directed RNA polymerase subunit alpha n=1 Tax=Mycoplasma corogypsi TaxID=2106 RepID=UPI0038735E70